MPMNDDDGEPAAAAPEPAVRGALGAWWRQGLRTAALLHPDWRGLRTTPGIVATLVLAPMLGGLLFERIVMDGPVRFYWPGLLVGWMTPAVTLWVCWCLARRAQDGDRRDAPTATALFAMLSAQGLFVMLVSGVVMSAMVRHGIFAGMAHAQWGWWGVSAVLVGWYLAAQLALLWRSGTRRTAPRLVASGVLVATIAVHALLQPIRHWYPDYSASKADANASQPLRLTQELLEFQPQ